MKIFTKNLGRALAAVAMLMMSQSMLAGGGTYFYKNVYVRCDVMPTGAGEVYLQSGDVYVTYGDRGEGYGDINSVDPSETMPSVPGEYSEIMFTAHNTDEWDDGGTMRYRLWMNATLVESQDYIDEGYVFKGFTDKYSEDGVYDDSDFYTGYDIKDGDEHVTGTVVPDGNNPILRDTTNADMTFVINVNKDWSITPEDGTKVEEGMTDAQARDAERATGFPDTPIQIYAVYGLPDDPSGIHGVVADKADVNAPIYNAAGQRVGKSYKGLVIKNGKKYIQNNK